MLQTPEPLSFLHETIHIQANPFKAQQCDFNPLQTRNSTLNQLLTTFQQIDFILIRPLAISNVVDIDYINIHTGPASQMCHC